MGKINVSEMAALLVDNYGLTKQEAQRFITQMVEVVREGVKRDKQVKIKGLGTFKVIEVEARESVNVNTGERVTIDSHSKLTFTPDAALKELVNKPFSQFETVVLNEGVTFDDMVSNTEEPPVVEEVPVVQETPVVKETLFAEETSTEEAPEEEVDSAVEEAPVAEEAPVVEETSEEEDTPAVEEENTDAEEDDEDEDTEEKSSWRKWLLWVPIIILGGALCFGIGYYFGHNQQVAPVIIPAQKPAPPTALDSAELAASDLPVRESPLDSVNIQKTKVKEEKPVAKPEEPKPEEKAKPEQPKPEEKAKPEQKAETKPQPQPEPDYKKYEAMDQRVRTGAYQIVGLDHVEKVKQGETLYRISRRALGPGMECYVEVYNGITKDTPLQIGQEIKIPKLKLKEAARKKLHRE